MEHLYYSNITNKTYHSEEECLKEEKLFKEKEENTKKSLDDARKELNKAYENYELAQNKAAEILEKSNNEVEAILKEAEDRVNKCKKALCDIEKKRHTTFIKKNNTLDDFLDSLYYILYK